MAYANAMNPGCRCCGGGGGTGKPGCFGCVFAPGAPFTYHWYYIIGLNPDLTYHLGGPIPVTIPWVADAPGGGAWISDWIEYPCPSLVRPTCAVDPYSNACRFIRFTVGYNLYPGCSFSEWQDPEQSYFRGCFSGAIVPNRGLTVGCNPVTVSWPEIYDGAYYQVPGMLHQ